MRPDGGGTGGGGGPAAAYVFRVRVRLPTEGVDARPDEFETTVRWPAAEPGESGWLFFRDHCWRGEASDERHLRSLLAERLGVPVVAAEFRELRCTRDYLERWEAAVADRLEAFGADDVAEVRHRHLGSSVHVTDDV